MQYKAQGRLIRGVGGLYEIALDPGEHPLGGMTVASRAKGNFRHAGMTPLVGDLVTVLYDEVAVARMREIEAGSEITDDGGGVVIEGILPRKNALIRPPMANLDLLFIAFAAAEPAPVTATIDKLIAIAEYNKIEPIPVICKCDVDPAAAKTLREIYEKAGFRVFCLSAKEGTGINALRDYLTEALPGRMAAFAGASGVGKSTLLNTLYPDLRLATGEISHKIARGKHTTRRVELYPLSGGYLADTPGFSMLDFVRFDFFTRDDLPYVMREFEPYLFKCRYTKCTHTKEEGCAVLAALRAGEIAPTRHESFLLMWEDLKNKREWDKK